MEYEVSVADFNGPLDLLLHLIKEKDMDLLNLDVAEVCDQYLSFINAMDPSLLETMAEYLVMAAQLIEMKSKMLLPKEELDEEDDFEAQRERMIQQLIEKNKIQQVLEVFEDSYHYRQSLHSKIPSTMEEYYVDTENQIPDDLEIYDLIKAMQHVFQRRALLQPLESKIARVEVSIDERTEQIKNYFDRHRDEYIDFEELFEDGDKVFIVVTFLAVLVLVKNKEVTLKQEKNFDKIYLKGNS